MDVTPVIGITPKNFMMIRWWEHSQKGVTDRQTDRRTDRRTDWTIHRAAWSQLQNAPLCDCNRERVALARRSDARPLWAQLRPPYDLCVSTTLIPRRHGSVRPSATTSDQNATLQRCYYDLGDHTTLLGRSRSVYCAHAASVPRSYGGHRRYDVHMAPFHGELECFELFLMQMRGFKYIEDEPWFHSSLNH